MLETRQYAVLEARACEAAERGELQSAAQLFEAALHHAGPSSSLGQLHEQLAQVLMEMEEHDAAYQHALQAADADRQWPAAWVTLGRAARNCGHLGQSLEAFSEAQRLDHSMESIGQEVAEVVALRVGLPGLNISCAPSLSLGPGGRLWECGIVLAQYLVQHPELAQGHLMELGAGSGICGITAAALGASVTCTDTLEVLSAVTQPHVQRNTDLVRQGGGSCEARVLDWQQRGKHSWQGCDCVLGADLVYAEHAVAPMVAVLADLRSANPDMRLLLAHKQRHAHVDAMLCQALRDAGLPVQPVLLQSDTCENIVVLTQSMATSLP